MYALLISISLFLFFFLNFTFSTGNIISPQLLLDMKNNQNFYQFEGSYDFFKKVVNDNFENLEEDNFYKINFINNLNGYEIVSVGTGIIIENNDLEKIEETKFQLLDDNIGYNFYINSKTGISNGTINYIIKSFINNNITIIGEQNFEVIK